jgi:hypothetical protein
MYHEFFEIFDRERDERAVAFQAGKPLIEILSVEELSELAAHARIINEIDGLTFETDFLEFDVDDIVAFNAFPREQFLYYCLASVIFFKEPSAIQKILTDYSASRDGDLLLKRTINIAEKKVGILLQTVRARDIGEESNNFLNEGVALYLKNMIVKDSGKKPKHKNQSASIKQKSHSNIHVTPAKQPVSVVKAIFWGLVAVFCFAMVAGIASNKGATLQQSVSGYSCEAGSHYDYGNCKRQKESLDALGKLYNDLQHR